MEKCSASPANLFNFLNSSEKEYILKRVNRKQVDNGESLFQFGDQATSLFYVAAGQFAVKKYTGFENKMQVVALLGTGAVIGEGAVDPEHIRTTTVVAVERSEVLELTQKQYAAIKVESPEIALKLVEYNSKMSSLRLDACTARLAHIL